MENLLIFLDPLTVDMIIQLSIATILGILIGAERSTSNKTAGMRTYALISLGSCFFVVISHAVSNQYLGLTAFDPMRVASQIVVGIGFVGGGLIMTEGKKVSGITTAAGLWVSAGIGMAVGFHMYNVAIFVTLVTLFIFTTLWHIERAMKRWSTRNIPHGDSSDDL